MANPEYHKHTNLVSVVGIDGAGKDSLVDDALYQLTTNQQHITAAKLGTDSYILSKGQQSEIHPWLNSKRQNLHRIAQEHNIPPLVTAVQGLSIVIQSRIFERQLARPKGEVDVLASVRDSRIDPAIYASLYGRGRGSRSSVERRLRNMQRITGAKRDLIIFLNTDPRVAIQRIDNVLAENPPGTQRRSKKDLHETPEKLSELSAAYKVALVALRQIQPTPVIEIDNSERTLTETTAAMIDFFDQSKTASIDSNAWLKM